MHFCRWQSITRRRLKASGLVAFSKALTAFKRLHPTIDAAAAPCRPIVMAASLLAILLPADTISHPAARRGQIAQQGPTSPGLRSSDHCKEQQIVIVSPELAQFVVHE